MAERKKAFRRLGQWVIRGLWPNQKFRATREGVIYILVWIGLLATGLNQQINLILLVAGLAAGPVVASVVVSASMLRRLRISRRIPSYVFSGEPLEIDYTLDNDRRVLAVLALILTDEMTPLDRAVSGSSMVHPIGFFPMVAGRTRARFRWKGTAPRRGKYRLRSIELATRSPFGLLERKLSVEAPAGITIYPAIGQLTRRWQLLHRRATETRRGSRHDRSTQQQEYHGFATTGRGTARGGSTGGPRPGSASRWSRSSSSRPSRT